MLNSELPANGSSNLTDFHPASSTHPFYTLLLEKMFLRYRFDSILPFRVLRWLSTAFKSKTSNLLTGCWYNTSSFLIILQVPLHAYAKTFRPFDWVILSSTFALQVRLCLLENTLDICTSFKPTLVSFQASSPVFRPLFWSGSV